MRARGTKIREQSGHSQSCAPRHALCAMRYAGFTYIALLTAIIILGISMTVVSKYWQNVVTREKEEELLFRGTEYVRAIEKFRKALGGGVTRRGPATIEELLSDPQFPGKRHLRRKYKDPITGEDFVIVYSVVQGQPKQIIAVHSPSDREPLKQSNFPKAPYDFSSFAGKKKYSEWFFEAKQEAAVTSVPISKSTPPK